MRTSFLHFFLGVSFAVPVIYFVICSFDFANGQIKKKETLLKKVQEVVQDETVLAQSPESEKSIREQIKEMEAILKEMSGKKEEDAVLMEGLPQGSHEPQYLGNNWRLFGWMREVKTKKGKVRLKCMFLIHPKYGITKVGNLEF